MKWEQGGARTSARQRPCADLSLDRAGTRQCAHKCRTETVCGSQSRKSRNKTVCASAGVSSNVHRHTQPRLAGQTSERERETHNHLLQLSLSHRGTHSLTRRGYLTTTITPVGTQIPLIIQLQIQVEFQVEFQVKIPTCASRVMIRAAAASCLRAAVVARVVAAASERSSSLHFSSTRCALPRRSIASWSCKGKKTGGWSAVAEQSRPLALSLFSFSSSFSPSLS